MAAPCLFKETQLLAEIKFLQQPEGNLFFYISFIKNLPKSTSNVGTFLGREDMLAAAHNLKGLWES